MSYFQTLCAYLTLLVAIILVPGMDMLLVVGITLSQGLKCGLSAVAGITFGGLAHAVIGATSVAILMQTGPLVFTVATYLGCVYMAWIGLGLVRSTSLLTTMAQRPKGSPLSAFGRGMTTALLNPKAYMFIGATFPLFIRYEYGPIWLQASVLSGMTAFVQIAIYGGLSLAIARAGEKGMISSRMAGVGAKTAGAILLLISILTVMNTARF